MATREELMMLHEDLCNRARALSRKKNHDYSGGKDATARSWAYARRRLVSLSVSATRSPASTPLLIPTLSTRWTMSAFWTPSSTSSTTR
jgi:hypothetical protein